MSFHSFPILLVDDNKHDVKFMQRAWRIYKIPNPLFVVPNGQACLDFLYHRGAYSQAADSPRPGIILMDIRMPVMNGIECLQQIKRDPNLCTIPVIMLTTSGEDQDLQQSYRLGCSSYIQKPVEFDRLGSALQTIHQYWTMSELPRYGFLF